MSHSEDEDDFLSADEDIGPDGEICDIEPEGKREQEKRSAEIRSESKESSNNLVINETKQHAIQNKPKDEEQGFVCRDVVNDKMKEPIEEAALKCVEAAGKKPVGRVEKEGLSNKAESGDHDDDDDGGDSDDDEEDDGEEEDDEEAALAERIRERNLKIARNFSVEIAKNLKASAPIPVKASPGSIQRERERTYNDSLLGDPDNGSINPPAPPPTPALSSSFNNLSDQAIQTPSGTSPSLSTQYSWRIPPRTASSHSVTTDSTSATATATTTSTTTTTQTASGGQQSNDSSSLACKMAAAGGVDGSEQARLALDRLSEKLGQPDKNLFERVAADIRNMSIKSDDTLTAADVTSQLNALPATITDLGSTLGGWGWSGATKLLSSATQVTSQMGSVLNSIVDVGSNHQTQAVVDPNNGSTLDAGGLSAKHYKKSAKFD